MHSQIPCPFLLHPIWKDSNSTWHERLAAVQAKNCHLKPYWICLESCPKNLHRDVNRFWMARSVSLGKTQCHNPHHDSPPFHPFMFITVKQNSVARLILLT